MFFNIYTFWVYFYMYIYTTHQLVGRLPEFSTPRPVEVDALHHVKLPRLQESNQDLHLHNFWSKVGHCTDARIVERSVRCMYDI